MGSDGEERRSETPTPEHGEVEESSTGAGGSYRETPPSISLPASDPWADFNQPSSRKNFYSSSDRCLFRARCLALFDMPNSNRFDILSISIFCKIDLSISISIFSKITISISISISIFLE